MGPLVMHHEDHEECEGRAAKFSHVFLILVPFVVVKVLDDLYAEPYSVIILKISDHVHS